MNSYEKIQPTGVTGGLEIPLRKSSDKYVTIQSESPSISASLNSANYDKVLNRNEDIFNGESSIASFIVAPEVKQTAMIVLAELKAQILNSADLQFNQGKLPSLMITQSEDSIT
jgi:hypothetical protein